VVDELLQTSPMGVTLDALSNALKSRGFRRPPGSPRLITRLRNLKGIEVTRTGIVRLMQVSAPPPAVHREEDIPRHPVAQLAGMPQIIATNFDRPAAAVTAEGNGGVDADIDGEEDESAGPGNEAEPGERAEAGQPAESAPGRRRRRGGRRRRGRRGRGGARGPGGGSGPLDAPAPQSESA
jgi:hypothetical protein